MSKLYSLICKRKLVIIIISSLIVIGGIIGIFSINSKEEEKYCSVSFETNGGTKLQNIQVKCGEKIDKPEIPLKNGFEFENWYYNEKIYDFSTIVDKNIILTAKWNVLPETEIINVYFDSNGGTRVDSVQISKGEKVYEPLTPVKKGYKFVCWQLNNETYNFDSIVNDEIILVAVWKKINSNSNINDSSNENIELDNNINSDSSNKADNNIDWDFLKGTWYLTGTDDVYITFREDKDNYYYNGTRFEFHSSSIDYTGGNGGSFQKDRNYPISSILYYINVTSTTKNSITIDNKYTFYREKNYPSHIKSELEKFVDNLSGTWYLEGYGENVYVKFYEGMKDNEKVLFELRHNFCGNCTESGVFENDISDSYDSAHNYYFLFSEIAGLKTKGWEYSNQKLYYKIGNKKFIFNKSPISIPVDSIVLNKNNLNIHTGFGETLIATIKPSNATNKDLIWTSSNPSIVSVSEGGYIYALKPGKSIITVKSITEGKSASCNVTVTDAPVESITLNKTSINLIRGKKDTITATLTPTYAKTDIIWKSSNENIAWVTTYEAPMNGVIVTGKGKGTTTITATTTNGEKVASCVVNVTHPELTADVEYKLDTILWPTDDSTRVKIIAHVAAKGGTGEYPYYYIKLYNSDNVLLDKTIDTSLSVSVSDYLTLEEFNSHGYYVEFEVRDSDGTSYTKKTEIVNLTF